jgi:hypothetical protein
MPLQMSVAPCRRRTPDLIIPAIEFLANRVLPGKSGLATVSAARGIGTFLLSAFMEYRFLKVDKLLEHNITHV